LFRKAIVMDIYEFFRGDRYAALSGVELIEARPGYARAAMAIGPHHLNAGGVVQGGAIFTLADLAFAAAINGYGNLAVSMQTGIWFHKTVNAGTLRAEAVEIRTGRSVGTVEVKVTDERDEPVATFVASAFRMDTQLPFAAE
jgi:acyl-CoA thioesterase